MSVSHPPNKSLETTRVGAVSPLSRITSRVGGGSAFFVGQPGGAFGFSFSFRPADGDSSAGLLTRAGFGFSSATNTAEFSESYSSGIFHCTKHFAAPSASAEIPIPSISSAARRDFGP